MSRVTSHVSRVTCQMSHVSGFHRRDNIHLRFKQAQPKMCHSPKVEDKVENQFFTS